MKTEKLIGKLIESIVRDDPTVVLTSLAVHRILTALVYIEKKGRKQAFKEAAEMLNSGCEDIYNQLLDKSS